MLIAVINEMDKGTACEAFPHRRNRVTWDCQSIECAVCKDCQEKRGNIMCCRGFPWVLHVQYWETLKVEETLGTRCWNVCVQRRCSRCDTDGICYAAVSRCCRDGSLTSWIYWQACKSMRYRFFMRGHTLYATKIKKRIQTCKFTHSFCKYQWKDTF